MFLVNTIIPQKDINAKQIDSRVSIFCKTFLLGRLLRKCNIIKLKGASCLQVFKFIFQLIFSGKNLYQLLQTKGYEPPFEKDVVYDFLNSVSYNWRKFLLLLSSKIIKRKLYPLTSEKRINVLIFDDSVYSRPRSKAVELLAKVRDHATGKYVKGLRLLTMGWSDGNSFIPVAFSLLSSRKEENRYNGIKADIDKRTNGYKRRQEALGKATEVMFDLLEGATKYDIPVDYILFDSWFAFPKIIGKVLEYEKQVVCRLKSLPNIRYRYKGRNLSLKQLYNTVKKKPGNEIIASVIVGMEVDEIDSKFQAKIIFVSDDNKNGWIALLTTDTSLKDQEIIRIYGKRWDIEVFFKMSKSYLKLAKEFQGRSYDMMVAHTTIVFARYILLALENRKFKDSKTFGNMFFELCDELDDIRFIESLYLVLDLLKQSLIDCLKLSEQKIDQLFNHFAELLPRYFKEPLMIFNSES